MRLHVCQIYITYRVLLYMPVMYVVRSMYLHKYIHEPVSPLGVCGYSYMVQTAASASQWRRFYSREGDSWTTYKYHSGGGGGGAYINCVVSMHHHHAESRRAGCTGQRGSMFANGFFGLQDLVESTTMCEAPCIYIYMPYIFVHAVDRLKRFESMTIVCISFHVCAMVF